MQKGITFTKEIDNLYSERLGDNRKVNDIIYFNWLILAILVRYKGKLINYTTYNEIMRKRFIRREKLLKLKLKFRRQPKVVYIVVNNYRNRW